MSILLFSPVGQPEVIQRIPKRAVENLKGMRVGYIFNQHTSALTFWKSLEEAIAAGLEPAATHRVYKTNTWAPAPQTDVERLVRETDYAIVGVGA